MVASIVATTSPTTNFVVFSSTDVTIPNIAGYVPVLGDTVYVFGNQESQSSTMFTTADWAIASTNVVTAANIVFCRGHAITPAEVAAGTNGWTISGVFGSGGSGRGIAVVVRGADQTTSPVVATALSAGATAVAPPAVTPVRDGALILSYVGPDDRARTITDPGAGWTRLQKASGVTNVISQQLSRRDAYAPGGVAVDMSNAAVTLNAADECGAITIAIDQPANNNGGIFACL